MRTAVRRLLAVLALAVVAACVLGAMQGGRYLQHEDPLRKADAIFVLGGTRLERPLEAVDLYREGWAPLVALSPGRPEDVESLLHARGFRFPSEIDVVRDLMTQMGVPRRRSSWKARSSTTPRKKRNCCARWPCGAAGAPSSS